MAEERKEQKKYTDADFIAQVTLVLAGLFLLSLIVAGTSQYLEYYRLGNLAYFWSRIRDLILYTLWPILKILGIIASVVSIGVIIYSNRKLAPIVREERSIYHLVSIAGAVAAKNHKWEAILVHINSANPSNWRLAVIEADILLDELLRRSGYDGESVGDMLKQVDKSNLLSLDNAWEAHKVRNRIVHSGAEFELNEREAKRAISLYESVFKEIGAI